jgi:lipopolysaccharide transport system permease protein
MVWQQVPIVIRRRQGWRMIDLQEIWRYRDLLLLLGFRELKLRYRQTLLGTAWVILQPLLGAAAIALVFGRLVGLKSGGAPYFLLAFTGLVGWSIFSVTLTRATTCLVNQPQLITKVSFPRLVVPLSTAIAPIVDCVVSLLALVPLLFVSGLRPTLGMLFVPLWLVGLLGLSLGLGFFLCSLAVSYRDVQHILPFALQVLLFMSPVAYSIDVVPERVRLLYRLNPLAVMVDGLRDSTLGRRTEADGLMILAFVVSAAFFVSGWLFFARAERRFADVI